jgi:hypothetical protein
MFGPDGKIKTGTPLRITGQAAEPASISSDYVYLHVGGRPGYEYTQARHNAVNEWWDKYGKERLVYYFMEDHEIFDGNAGQRHTTILNKLGIIGRGDLPGGGSPVLNTSRSDAPIYKYLVQNGPFGTSGQFARAYLDGTNTVVSASTLPGSAIPLIVDSEHPDYVYLFIDPVNNLIYQGESQIFDTYIDSPVLTLAGTSNSSDRNLSCFLANLLAYVMNASQYGSHYTDLFKAENEALYNDAFTE